MVPPEQEADHPDNDGQGYDHKRTGSGHYRVFSHSKLAAEPSPARFPGSDEINRHCGIIWFC